LPVVERGRRVAELDRRDAGVTVGVDGAVQVAAVLVIEVADPVETAMVPVVKLTTRRR